ncbi:hypothetical protein ACOKGD_10030 [Microbacterium phosphatis]|uniref:hypothetical protein n=1 Tax=Microbacterium phosphatis TaxID=3140248 RepID=UPI0031407C2F
MSYTDMPPAGSAWTAISRPPLVVRYPAYSVSPMYIGFVMNRACTPLIVTSVAEITAA